MWKWLEAFAEYSREKKREEFRDFLRGWSEEGLEGLLDITLSVIAEKQSENCFKKELDERYRRKYGVK